MTISSRNKLLIAIAVFFLLVNTSYFWEPWLGFLAMLTFLFLAIYIVVLGIILIGQVVKSIRERFQDKNRLLVIGLLTVVIGTSIIRPFGIIDYSWFEAKSIFTAQHEGAANCRVTLNLREDNSFLERSVCFGITEISGRYRLSDDTIFFEDISLGRHEEEYYQFAVVKEDTLFGNELGVFVRYKGLTDTTGSPLWIAKNELKK